MTAVPMPLTRPEQARALEIARALAHAGVPLFLGEPDPQSKTGWRLPAQWERTQPDPSVVDRWLPGWALCAVGGHACDFLDIDPRNGGSEAAERLQTAGWWPVSYGCQATPSGGRHEIITPLRAGKGALRRDAHDAATALGIDLQGGRPDGTGRGFVFLAPTERPSKADGVRRAYRWLREPDLTGLAAGGDASGARLVELLPRRAPVQEATTQRPHEIFINLTPERAGQLVHEACLKVTERAAAATAPERWAGFRDTLCLDAAYTLGGLAGSGYLQAGAAEQALITAITAAGHLPDDDDLRWIEQGITEGSRRPIWVQRPRAPAAMLARPPLPSANLPEEFWAARRVLTEIRAAAHARAESADAVLGVVLARLSSLMPGGLRVDTGIATPAALNFFAILLGPSAAGKTTAAQVAESLFPVMAFADCESWPLGSGQGIAARYGEVVDGKFEQSRVKMMFHADEGSTLLALARKPEDITLATLRTCWSGGPFGQANATGSLTRRVCGYSMGLWIGLQHTHAAGLFSARSVDEGTLQRFAWFSATDPSLPRARCTAAVRPVSWDLAAAWNAHAIDIPQWLQDELYDRRVAVSLGELVPEPGREHEPLIRVKISCLLAILDSRHGVTREDWDLSAVVLDTSSAVAQTVRDRAASRERDAEAAQTARRLRQLDAEVQHAERREDTRLAALVERVVARVTEKPGIGRRVLLRMLVQHKDRELAETALELAVESGRVAVRDSRSSHGHALYPIL